MRADRVRQRAEQVEREQATAAARERLEGIEERVGAMSDDEREQARADIALVFGRFSTEGWQLERLLKQAAADDPQADADVQAGDDEPAGGSALAADDEALAA